jgi:hypothetical protein
MGSCDFRRPEDTAAVDGFLHLMGDRIRRVGSSPKHRTEAARQAVGLSANIHRR